MKYILMFCFGLGMALGAFGCACTVPIKPETAPAAMVPQQDSVAAVPEVAAPVESQVQAPDLAWRTYTVKKGDSLWKIAGMHSVLGDPMLWPILYRTNRDQIADQDLIQIHQELKYSQKIDTAQLDDANREARATPPYVHPRANENIEASRE